MPAFRLVTGQEFERHHVLYRVMRLLPDHQINIEAQDSGAVEVLSEQTLLDALFAGEIRFVAPHLPVEDHPSHQILDLADDERGLAIARFRLSIIEPLLDGDHTRAEVTAYVASLKANRSPNSRKGLDNSLSVTSIYRWLSAYKNSGGDLRALLPRMRGKRGGAGRSRLGGALDIIIDHILHDNLYKRETTSLFELQTLVAAQVEEENKTRLPAERLSIPGINTIKRRIEAEDWQDRLIAKKGKRAAKRATKQYEKSVRATMALERVEIDNTRSDLIVIDDEDSLPLGRLTLTWCLDVATAYPLGYYMGFEPSNYAAVKECLYHAILPKPDTRELYGTENLWLAHGIPLVVACDNGPDFVNRSLDDAGVLLGFEIDHMPVKTPEFKGAVERSFRSLNTMFFHTLPGTTFSNIRERGDYDSMRQACVYLSKVDEAFHQMVVDKYTQTFHKGINGIPARRWEVMFNQYPPRLPESAEALSIMLGSVEHRTVQHYGIDFENIRYNNPHLAALRYRLDGEKTKIKYHPLDLSHIYVYNPFERVYIEAFPVGEWAEYTLNLSLWKHRVIRRAVLEEQASVDLAALGRARRRIQDIVNVGRSRKRTATRAKVARWETGGKPSREIGTKPSVTPTKPASPARPTAPLPAPGNPSPTDDNDGWGFEFSDPSNRLH